MNKRAILISVTCLLLLLIGSNVFFIIQSSRLSGQLVRASALIRQTALDHVTDREYNLRRENARIHATEEQIVTLAVRPAGDTALVSFPEFAGQEEGIYMYFSPNVCEPCLYNEVAMQDSLHAAGQFNNRMTILASKDYIRNLRSKFQNRTLPCEYAVVDYRVLPERSILKIMNEPLLFRWENGRVKDIFVPSKSNRTYSELYYRYIQTLSE